MNMHFGHVFMVVAPSGAGKSSLVNALLERDPGMVLSVSCTTRAPRPGEQEGRDYRFVSKPQFEALRDRGEMLEWACVHDNLYGTPRDRVVQAIEASRDIVLEIDWQGARKVRQQLPRAIGVFILPPSMDALETRLRNRGQDSEAVIARRMASARDEMSHAEDCEYVIINQDFNVALQQLQHIVEAARLRFQTQAARQARLFSSLGATHATPTHVS